MIQSTLFSILILLSAAIGGLPAHAAPPQPPTVTSISPDSGPTTGGTSVTITGTNFTGATAVTKTMTLFAEDIAAELQSETP